jgi:transposase
MWHVGIDLHRATVVLAAVNDAGQVQAPITLRCTEPEAIVEVVQKLQPFRAVIEATGTYRWLYQLLRPYGGVLLAHPLRLRAMIQRRSKTDKLDALLLAHLLRIDQVPLAYIPPEPYQQLRELTRNRARLVRQQTLVKIGLRGLLARRNVPAPLRRPFGPRGLAWLRRQDFGPLDNLLRDEYLARREHFARQVEIFDGELERLRELFPEAEALTAIYGVGLFSALMILGELGEVERFRTARQVSSYAGLTARVEQSGGHCYHGRITRQGSPWLRWILVEAAMKVTRQDTALKNFYARIRKRSSAKIARVAVARKLAEICWKRLRRWRAEHAGPSA